MPKLARVLELRDEALAEDIEVDQAMTDWTESEVVGFFEAGGELAQLPREHPASSTLLKRVARTCHFVTDLHVEHKANAACLDTLPDGEGGAPAPGSVLLCGGDVATKPELMRQALRAMTRAYEIVFFVPGNHDVWVRSKSEPNSLRKYEQLLAICEEEGVQTRPERLVAPDGRGVWIVPMASW